ncbi:MAG: hypothetical protein IT249_20020 [Chitinophagaceae bacterium]|nr:hypothetical protein [Chitinophagaceae bacterium]
MKKKYYSEQYNGYTIICINNGWRIAGLPGLLFFSLDAARRYIDKLIS